VEDEITEAIVTALEPALRAPIAAPRAAPSAAGLEAYELYLRGRHAWHQRTLSGVRAGLECFERAARLDPTFARAYTGIADAYATLRTYGVLRWEEARPRAKAASDRALALDPTLAETNLSAAMFRLHFDEELALAEAWFQKAIEINPCSSLAQVYYGIFLALRQRDEDAVTQVEIARDLDPLSPMIQSLASLALLMARRFEAAFEVADRALALQSDFPVTLAVRGMACCKLDRLEDATATFERLVTVSRRAPIYLGMLAIARAYSGREDEARALGAEIAALETVGYVSPHCDLMVQAGLRDRDGVERALGRCRQDRTSALVVASTAGSFLPIDDEPRAERARLEQIPVTMASPRAGSLEVSEKMPVQSRAGGHARVVAGKYRLLAPLGRGGMGVVYRAQDVFIHREVAVKLLDVRDESAHERLRRRMHREVIISGRLAHPRIVTVYDAGLDGDDMYLVMELVAGENLGQRLAREGRMPIERVVDVALQLADALGYAHRQGVVHRDLKPGNVLVGGDGRIKVADFGLAKLRSLAGADDELPHALREGLTAGNAIGTAGYMAPEQLLGLAVDQRADIWAIGALLFELASGAPLSEHVPPLSLSAALVGDAPPPAIPPLVPAELETVVTRALAVRRSDRFASCEELAEALRAIPTPAAR
jgi:tetratricopeptide (TPR) repeat protein